MFGCMESTSVQNGGVRGRLRRFWSGSHRARLMLTLALAVMLPAAALIVTNAYHLKSIERDKVLEAAIHREFQYMLATSEKQINQKAYKLTEEVRNAFPSLDTDRAERARQLDDILSKRPWLAHVFLYDADKGLVFRSQPERLSEPEFLEEHKRIAKGFNTWFSFEAKSMLEGIHKSARSMMWYPEAAQRADGDAYMTNAFFTHPQATKDCVAIAGISIEPDYLKQTFFPKMLEELIAYKLGEKGPNPLAMIVYRAASESDAGWSASMGGQPKNLLAASAGWTEGKPEVSRNFDDVFRGLALGIKFQGTSVEALGQRWIHNSMVILGILSLVLIGGLVLTYRSVSKEVALARLKSDFVSNVSHELRTPLALIRLYSETLELGRINAQDKVQEYYRIIRTESERLTALINNILDFSRIEAGRKEYEFRTTDMAELVTNTLDSYRGQIDEQGFTFEQSIDPSIPPVRVDREAIARSLVNLVNNALKYSDHEKVLKVKLYRTDSVLKLEVADHGIGIARSEQSKIFEKFYRAGDPLVHNTKGSGLGLSLVRHIAHAHGGEVEVESSPGNGSTFTLWLPLAADVEQAGNGSARRMAG
jgi:signal transduction histidine kinase